MLMQKLQPAESSELAPVLGVPNAEDMLTRGSRVSEGREREQLIQRAAKKWLRNTFSDYRVREMSTRAVRRVRTASSLISTLRFFDASARCI